jgi:hypothetical protein
MLLHPGAEMDFVDRNRRRQGVAVAAFGHPFLVVPGIIEVPDEGGGARRDLMEEGERVHLVHTIAVVVRYDVILVGGAVADAWDEAGPDAGGALGVQRVLVLAPAVEIAHDEHAGRRGCPDREVRARDSVDGVRMGAHLVVEAEVAALVE